MQNVTLLQFSLLSFKNKIKTLVPVENLQNMVHLKNYGVFVSITIFSSALARCLWSVKCPCGISDTSFSFCLDVPPRDGATCARWANCATCRNYSNECRSCPAGRSGASCDQIISFGNELKRQNPNETASSNSINYKRVRKRSSAVMLSCPDPGPVVNAMKKMIYTQKQDFFPGEMVGYVCHPGYALVGDPVLRCLNDSQWSAEVPECYLYAVANNTVSETLCSDPGKVANADIIWRPQAAMFSCHNGYVRVGNSVLRCVVPGRWDGQLPRCIRQRRRQGSVDKSPDVDTLSLSECLDPGELDNADRFTDGLPEDTYFHTISYRCAPGYTAVGASVIKCLGNDRWSSEKPKCEKVELNPQASLTSSYEDDYDDDEDSDDDRVTYCDSPGPIDNGHWKILSYYKGYGVTPIVDDDEFPERTRLKFFCDNGYSLVGRFPTIHCQQSGLWSRPTPFCHLECGYSTLHSLKKVHRGVHTEPGEWPWTVAISKIAGGFTKLICGGSLLDNRTVLTAAHCLMNPDLENTTDIRLYFGKYNRSDKLDDDQVVTRTASVFIIHPKYDAETKDNDIALIRVEQPIEYTSRISSVCLPTAKTSQQNLQPGSSGFVVGWGTTELNLDSEELLMAILPVVPAPECRSSLKRQKIRMLITSNMFCAGFAEGGVASCRGDSGGPLVFHDPQTDRHTVEGIVSFGRHRECGMPGRFTVYTQVSRYLDWIKESMEAMSDPRLASPLPTTDKPLCDIGKRACANGDCIASDLFCNGPSDCSDNSDKYACMVDRDPDRAPLCDPSRCVLPDCFCSADGTDIPGKLESDTVPQMVTITFNDAVNSNNINVYERLFRQGRNNPNGCSVKATFFVSHKYTNYSAIQELHRKGHEMAAHSITHRIEEKYWTNASLDTWTKEMGGVRLIMERFGNITDNSIVGVRAPFLQVGGNSQFTMMEEQAFLYDSTLTAPLSNPPLWPYTLYFRMPHKCHNKGQNCPTRSHAVWEMVMNELDSRKDPTDELGVCVMMDSCNNIISGEQFYHFLNNNFNRHYKTNRAPLGLYFHANWLWRNQEYLDALVQWIDEVLGMNDVYFVTMTQALQWMHSPTKLSSIRDFAPWKEKCDVKGKPFCTRPNACPLNNRELPGENIRLHTCMKCPQNYPWIEDPTGHDFAFKT